jgi:hypothetical protein
MSTESFCAGQQVVVDAPPSCYHGLTGTLLELVDYGAVLTFSEAECDRVEDRRRVTHNKPIPFPHGSFVRCGEAIRPKSQMPPNQPPTPLPHEVCGCGLFGPPCGLCGQCQYCNIRIKGEFFDIHAWRHYYGSQAHAEVLEIMRQERVAADPEPACKKKPSVFPAQILTSSEVTPLESSSTQPGPQPKPPAQGQVSLWD